MFSVSDTNVARIGLLTTVFFTGGAVMIIELLGTRLIAPFYGASLYVWSSLIAVTMIALALGYYVGGLLADRAKRFGLSAIIALAGLLTLLIPWLTRAVLLATDPLGLRAGAFVSALLLFSPSLTMLGMAGPFAIKLAAHRLDKLGNTVGSIYAISTIGSVSATLLLGFFLFPYIGSREILIGLGILLFMLAIAVAVFERKTLGLPTIMIPTLTFILIGLVILPNAVSASHLYQDTQFKVLSEQESMYGWVRVIDKPSQDLRLLTSDASAIGATSISTGQNRLAYQNIVGLIPGMADNKMSRALVIGLGVGHMAKMLHDQYDMTTDTLEIDPAVAQAATDYFGFKPTGKAIIGDARYEIRHLTDRYDLIIHDCFTGGSEPSHLLTEETLSQLRDLLTEEGILSLNFVGFSKGEQQAALASVAKTIAQVFPYQTVYISEPGNDFNDFIFLASRHPINTDSAKLQVEQKRWLQARAFKVNQALGVVLTDNLNPLEHLQANKASHYRHLMFELFGANLLVR